MILTKNTLIEGKIIKKGTEIKIREMPHMAFKDGTYFDIEIELHLKDEKELLVYFNNVLSGNKFSYSYGDNIQFTKSQIQELARYLVDSDNIKLILLKKYSQGVYDNFIRMVKSFI